MSSGQKKSPGKVEYPVDFSMAFYLSLDGSLRRRNEKYTENIVWILIFRATYFSSNAILYT